MIRKRKSRRKGAVCVALREAFKPFKKKKKKKTSLWSE